MNIKELQQMMAQDANIDETELSHESLRTPSLYTKYANIRYDLEMQLAELYEEQNKTKLRLSDYYLGKADDEVYKEKPKKIKVLKTDVDTYIKGDDEYNQLFKRVRQAEAILKQVEDFLKQISSRGFYIKNAIDYQKFQNGGY